MGSGNPASIGNESNAAGSAMFHGIPIYQMAIEPSEGLYEFDNFGNVPSMVAADTSGPYKVYLDTGNTITRAAVRGGAALFTTDGTDNDEVAMQWGGPAGGSYFIDRSSNLAVVAFEVLLQQSVISDNAWAWAAGLGITNLAVADSLADNTGDLVATAGFIGFQVLHANGGTAGTNAVVKFVYQAASQTKQVVIASLATLVAATDIKLGFRYDPGRPPSQRISAWVNDVEKASAYISDTQIAAATFPSATALSPYFHAKRGGTAGADTMTWKYWRAAYKPL